MEGMPFGRAEILRCTGRNTFAVKLDGLPGVHEVSCSGWIVIPRVEFGFSVNARNNALAGITYALSNTQRPINHSVGAAAGRSKLFV